MTNQSFTILPGQPYPLGATADPGGVNFAVFSQHASKVFLCLFDENGEENQIITNGTVL